MEANKENQQSMEQAFNQALDAYKAGNFAEAAGQWLALAEDGCAPAQRALGSLYERGQGVEKNAENAFEWTKKAAEQNDPVAMFNLACYHDKGVGVKKNQQTALTWYRKAEDAEDFTSRGEMFDSIVSALGGRIAEQLFLDDISTGASGDIQQATNIARDMVMKYGMSEKLGPISFDDSSHSIFIGRDFGTTKSYSEETAATIDEEVKHIFDQAYAKCEALLREHADLLTGLAEYLLIHETIEGDDFRYYCEHGVMPVHPDDTIEPPAKVIRRMDEAPVAPQPDTEAPAQPTDVDTPEAGSDKTE